MGVEYAQGLFVADTNWRPSWRHVEQIDAVLTRWGFRRVESPYYALVGEDCQELEEAPASSLPPNLMVVYDTLEGASVRAVIGPSIDPSLDDSDRYIMSTTLYLGADYKVVQAEGEEVEVRAATERLVAVSALPTFVDVYPATWSTPRPASDGRGDFARIWRCGLVLDCHTDVPAIARDRGPLPARDFVRELEGAFETQLVELGWWH